MHNTGAKRASYFLPISRMRVASTPAPRLSVRIDQRHSMVWSQIHNQKITRIKSPINDDEQGCFLKDPGEPTTAKLLKLRFKSCFLEITAFALAYSMPGFCRVNRVSPSSGRNRPIHPMLGAATPMKSSFRVLCDLPLLTRAEISRGTNELAVVQL